jgi:eukaryotic-like serine/threonine-protein kinase
MSGGETGYHPVVNGSHGHLLAGRYRLHEMIGSGGAGTVWAGVDEVLGRRVAVKDVGGPRWADLEGQRAVRERTMREARAAALIDHPNVVRVYDVVEVDDRPWIVMELVDAPTLAQVIEEHGPRSPAEAARIGLQVLAALRAAHALGILHRDVKPSNVMVTEDRAVLADFGIATRDGDVGLTASGVLVGAPAFIAPERVRAEPGTQVGPASDLWSLGATLYNAVEGRPPYQRDGAICTIAAVVHDEPDPVERAGHLAPVLAALLRHEPELRPSATEVRELLLHVIDREHRAELAKADEDTEPVATTVIHGREQRKRPQKSTGEHAREPSRTRAHAVALFSAAGLLFTILLVGIFAELVGGSRPPDSPVDREPAVDTPASPGAPAPAGNNGGGRSGADTTSVEPAAEVSSVGGAQPTVDPTSSPPPTAEPPEPTTTTDVVDPPTETTTEPTTSDPATTAGSTTPPASAPVAAP